MNTVTEKHGRQEVSIVIIINCNTWQLMLHQVVTKYMSVTAEDTGRGPGKICLDFCYNDREEGKTFRNLQKENAHPDW